MHGLAMDQFKLPSWQPIPKKDIICPMYRLQERYAAVGDKCKSPTFGLKAVISRGHKQFLSSTLTCLSLSEFACKIYGFSVTMFIHSKPFLVLPQGKKRAAVQSRKSLLNRDKEAPVSLRSIKPESCHSDNRSALWRVTCLCTSSSPSN